MYRSALALLFIAVLLLSGCTAGRQRIPQEKDTQGTDMAGQSSDMSGEDLLWLIIPLRGLSGMTMIQNLL